MATHDDNDNADAARSMNQPGAGAGAGAHTAPPVPQQPSEDPRVRQAAERTLLAWIRTGLARMSFGLVVASLGLSRANSPWPARFSGALHRHVVVDRDCAGGPGSRGATVLLLAARQHRGVLRQLERGEPLLPPSWSLGVVLAVLLALIGAAMVVYLSVVSR